MFPTLVSHFVPGSKFLRLALLAVVLAAALVALSAPDLAHACSLTGGGCGG